jgi:hypothetical protein
MWNISWWGSARPRLRLAHCKLLVGSSGTAIAQGTHLSHPQATESAVLVLQAARWRLEARDS